MSAGTFALVIILASIGAGLYAYTRFGRRGGTITDALAVIRSVFFILAGIGLIVGGFVFIGAFVVALFVYLGVGAGTEVKEDVFRRYIAGE